MVRPSSSLGHAYKGPLFLFWRNSSFPRSNLHKAQSHLSGPYRPNGCRFRSGYTDRCRFSIRRYATLPRDVHDVGRAGNLLLPHVSGGAEPRQRNAAFFANSQVDSVRKLVHHITCARTAVARISISLACPAMASPPRPVAVVGFGMVIGPPGAAGTSGRGIVSVASEAICGIGGETSWGCPAPPGAADAAPLPHPWSRHGCRRHPDRTGHTVTRRYRVRCSLWRTAFLGSLLSHCVLQLTGHSDQ